MQLYRELGLDPDQIEYDFSFGNEQKSNEGRTR